MKILVLDNNIGVSSVSINKLNKDAIKVIIDTKIKYPNVFRGSSYEGTTCVGLRITMMSPSVGVPHESDATVDLIPETKWEKEFINNCDCYMGSTRYGPEFIYVRRETKYNALGYWHRDGLVV